MSSNSKSKSNAIFVQHCIYYGINPLLKRPYMARVSYGITHFHLAPTRESYLPDSATARRRWR